MSELITRLKIAFGLNPIKLSIQIVNVEEKSIQKTRYLICELKFVNLSNSVVILNSKVETNMIGAIRHANVPIPIESSKEFSTNNPTKINSKEEGVEKSLIFGTSWNSDIELIFSDSNGVNTKCKYPYSKIKIHTKPKSGWIKGTI